MITIGNVYGHGFDAKAISEVERLGFALRPDIGHYSGSQVLQFVDFERGPPLELIHVTDPDAYAAFVPDGMTPYSPGINLVLPAEPEKTLDDFAAEVRELRPYRIHVNYDGTADQGKPGWNYMNFGVPIVRDTFIWLTALDEPRPRHDRRTRHANGVSGLRGICLDVEAEELRPLSKLVGNELKRGALTVGDVTVWSRAVLAGPVAFAGKRFPLVAVILGSQDLDRPELGGGTTERTRFMDRPAIRIRTNPLSWDLLLVQE